MNLFVLIFKVRLILMLLVLVKIGSVPMRYPELELKEWVVKIIPALFAFFLLYYLGTKEDRDL